MKRLYAIAGSFLLILVAVCCTVGALISAFLFEVDSRLLFQVLLFSALVLSVSVSLLRFKGFLLFVPPALIALLLKLPEIGNGGKSAIYHITSEYNKWLYVPVIFPGAQATSHELTLFFVFLGLVLVFLLSTSVCLQQSPFLSVFYTAPLIFLTVVLIETRPDIRFLLGLAAFYITLLFSSSLHPTNSIKKGTSIFPALVLSLIILGAAYLIAPPDSYRRGNVLDYIDNYLRDSVEQIGADLNKKGLGWPQSISSGWRFNTDSVNISNAGTRIITGRSLLEVRASQAGTFYLRGFSMQDFDGSGWRGNSDEQPFYVESFYRGMPALIADLYGSSYPDIAPPALSMTIERTGEVSNMIYQPYFSLPISEIDSYPYTVDFYYTKKSMPGLYAALSSDEKSFLAENARSPSDSDMFPYYARVRSPWLYLSVEERTAEGLRELALDAGIDPEARRSEIVDMVAEYISTSARYTLTPHITPEGEDFALYFLQKSKQGYCIHFATAATLMLRALDIPARFTGGFVFTVSAADVGKITPVTDANAHAWVEVFYDGVGWIPLEVTPPYPGSGIPAGSFHNTDYAAPGLTPADHFEDADTSDGTAEDAVPEASSGPDSETDSPQASGTDAQPDSRADAVLGKRNGSILLSASLAAAFVLALVIFSVFVRNYRKKRLSRADANEVVLYAWRLVSRLGRYGKPPENMEEIALKARFSLHDITDEERVEMLESFLLYCADFRKRRNPVLRLRIKYVVSAMPDKNNRKTFS